MAKFASYANDVLDQTHNNGASGTVVIGGTTYTLPFKVELTTTLSVDTTPGTPFTGGSYAAQSLAGAMATAAASKSKASSAALTFSGMPAGTWVDVYTRDSSGTPKPITFRGGTSLAKTVNAGDTCLIPATSFVGTDA